MTVNKEFIAKWADALEANADKQGIRVLIDDRSGRRCALGQYVLCAYPSITGKEASAKEDDLDWHKGLRELSGLSTSEIIAIGRDNDRGASFHEIAKHLRETYL